MGRPRDIIRDVGQSLKETLFPLEVLTTAALNSITQSLIEDTEFTQSLIDLATTYAALNPSTNDDADSDFFLNTLWKDEGTEERSSWEMAADNLQEFLVNSSTDSTAGVRGDDAIALTQFSTRLLDAVSESTTLATEKHDPEFLEALLDIGKSYALLETLLDVGKSYALLNSVKNDALELSKQVMVPGRPTVEEFHRDRAHLSFVETLDELESHTHRFLVAEDTQEWSVELAAQWKTGLLEENELNEFKNQIEQQWEEGHAGGYGREAIQNRVAEHNIYRLLELD